MHQAPDPERLSTRVPVAQYPTALPTSNRALPDIRPVQLPYPAADSGVPGNRQRTHQKCLPRGPREVSRSAGSLTEAPKISRSYHQPLGPHAPQSQPAQSHWSPYVSAVSCCSLTMLRVKTSFLYALNAV